jgi:hypothetical protein
MTPSKSDRIAICGELVHSSLKYLKHRLLFFDRVGIFDLATIMVALRDLKSDTAEPIANDLEFLQSKNLIFEPPPISLRSPLDDDDKLDIFLKSALRADLEFDHDKYERIFERIFGLRPPQRQDQDLDSKKALLGALQFDARLCARSLQKVDGQAASVVLSEPLTLPRGLRRAALQNQSTDVVNIVLSKLPMPSELTPWEAILDFKADTDAQGYLHGLKVWMNEVTRQKFTPIEANDKLESLLFEYKKHLARPIRESGVFWPD